MNEITSIQFQIERQAISLSTRIDTIYSSLQELKRLTNILFELTPNDNKAIFDWIQSEQFNVDDDYFISDKTLNNFKNNVLADTSVTYHWPEKLKDNSELQHSFYALRSIGTTLKEMKVNLGDITIIYYQDIIKNACVAYPYFEINQVIPADFNWSEYYSCASVNPANNPRREIQWSPPNIDYSGEGLISIASIPIYQEDNYIGVWSIDVPFNTLHQQCILDTFIPEQTNFITDFEGNIIDHPTINAKINKEKGSFYQIDIKELEQGYEKLNLDSIKRQKSGELEISNDKGDIQIVLYQVVPKINWIMFATFPKDKVFESVRDKITDAFNMMKEKSLPDKIDIQVDKDMQVLINSYNDMIQVLAYNQAEKEEAQQKAFEIQRQLNKELDSLVKERTKELQTANNKLEALANTDSLTGLFNRRYFFTLVNSFLKINERESRKAAILMLDIDKFKNVNDTYGHDVGDEVLIAFAKQLLNNIRKGDIFARFGGEEFIVFLPYTNIEKASNVAEKIRTSIEAFNGITNINFTVSIGVSEYKDDINKAIKQADLALYKAKENGRNRAEVFSD